MLALNELLTRALTENKLSVSTDKQEKLIRYLELLETWNHVFNLTAITQPRDMVYLHLIDSLSAAPYIKGKRALDVGSGAGLPGIPLAITHPDQHWVTLDKNSKKTRFITQAIAELSIKNVEPVYSRCEDYKPATGFDVIISRAFGTLTLFAESTEHLLNSSGIFIAMKGKYPEEELSQLPARFKVEATHALSIKGVAAERHIVILSK